MGWFYALILMALCGPGLLLIAPSGAHAQRRALGSSVLAVLWLGALWTINRMILAPWRWLRAACVGARQPVLCGHGAPTARLNLR